MCETLARDKGEELRCDRCRRGIIFFWELGFTEQVSSKMRNRSKRNINLFTAPTHKKKLGLKIAHKSQ